MKTHFRSVFFQRMGGEAMMNFVRQANYRDRKREEERKTRKSEKDRER